MTRGHATNERILSDIQIDHLMHGGSLKLIKADKVVRCRDCAHFTEARSDDGKKTRRCSGVFAYIECDPDGYCKWGRREQ